MPDAQAVQTLIRDLQRRATALRADGDQRSARLMEQAAQALTRRAGDRWGTSWCPTEEELAQP